MRERWIFWYAVVLCAVGVLAALSVDTDSSADAAARRPPIGDPDRGDDDAGDVAPPATTTTTVPSVFPPLPDRTDVPAVETATGLVLPVVGGSPGAWEVLTPCAVTAVVDGVPVRGAHVVLDPGHGGSEPGAVGPSGQTERDVNLDIANRTASRLRALGATVVMTRPGDQRVTLQTRAAIALALQPIAFVSIHHNAAPLGSGPNPGSELYHQLDAPESKRLAGLLWEELQAAFTPFGNDWAVGDDPGARARQSLRTGDDFYGVLRRTETVPAVLTEAAFLSDPEEDALLATDAFRDAEADAIARAVVRLVSTDDPGAGYVATKVSDSPAGSGGGTAGCEDPPLS
ncbi:N-acetylmuramoyl-L-alanine amidase family protein [Actinospongicola halichondriae]|uniref:N-acetylmuramoyl-L-alanine amidase family protein n=1 Tax=Actinospongicola halichondriae TaxID=3236844 RepID=UPI003D4140C5